MSAEVSLVQCSDCKSVMPYSFVVIAHDGEQTAFMLLAACKKCKERGDPRSVRCFQSIDNQESFYFATLHKLPIILL